MMRKLFQNIVQISCIAQLGDLSIFDFQYVSAAVTFRYSLSIPFNSTSLLFEIKNQGGVGW